MREGLYEMCVHEIRGLRVKLNPRHHQLPKGVPEGTRYIYIVAELMELAKGKKIGDIAPGLRLGGDL